MQLPFSILRNAVSVTNNWAPSSEFASSSIPRWQILTGHAQPFRGARDLAFCLKVPLDSLLVWASSGGSGETARMRRLAWTFAARIDDKYQIRLTRPNTSVMIYGFGWTLTQICLVDSSILINWTSSFWILGISGVLFHFIPFRLQIHVCKPWSDTAFCNFWSGSALFAYVPFMGP